MNSTLATYLIAIASSALALNFIGLISIVVATRRKQLKVNEEKEEEEEEDDGIEGEQVEEEEVQQQETAGISINQRRTSSLIPIIILILIDCCSALLLVAPIHNFLTEIRWFNNVRCIIYGCMDMVVSLFEIYMACIISFDRYIITIEPKWGKWRCSSNYLKLISTGFVLILLWSFLPIFGYGKYSTFDDGLLCSLDWRQGNFEENSRTTAHRYIGFLTATCLVFVLIPVCIASSLYYSIIDYVDRTECAEDQSNQVCQWAPNGHIAKVGFGCLLVSVVPFFGYSIVCLNPMRSDLSNVSHIVMPVILSRFSALLNPVFYVFLNPQIVPIGMIRRKITHHNADQQSLYRTINLIADVPGMSFPILTPTLPRRQLPKIPSHLASPNHESSQML